MKKATLIGVLTLVLSLLAGIGIVAAAPAAYTVKSGDCLWNIASTNGVTVDQLKQLNGLSSDRLQVGQVLKLHSDAAPAVQPSAPAAPVVAEAAEAAKPNVPAQAAADTSLYVIQPGDSLWSIAQLYGTTADNLRTLNGLTGDALYAGESLKVNGTPAAVTVSRSGSNATGSRVIAKAAQYVGTPYRYGGAAPGGFDCSGFTSYIFKQFGISLNRTASGQYGQGTAVTKANLIPGDLVFFDTYGGVSHVGIYSGDGKFIHSSSPRSGGVIYSALSESYYASRYIGARRVIR